MFSVYIRRAEERGDVIFPNRFCSTDAEADKAEQDGTDLKSLEGLKRQKGPYEYGCQYLNDPVDDASIEFRREWFRRFQMDNDTIPLLRNAKSVMSVDPAFKLKETHDDTGITITTPTDQEIYIREAMGVKLNPEQLIEKIFELVPVYNIYKVKIETVSAQILLADMLRKEMQKRGVMFMIDEYHPGTKETKATRIRKLIPYYANGSVLHRQGLIDLEEQLVQFPRGRKDDIIDSLAAQIADWNVLKKSTPKKNKAYTFEWWKKQVTNRPSKIQKLFGDLRRPY